MQTAVTADLKSAQILLFAFKTDFTKTLCVGRPKGFFQFKITINILVSSFRFIWIPMLWVYGHYLIMIKNICTLTVRGSNLESESDVYRRQILTTKVAPRAVKFKPGIVTNTMT